MDLEWNALNMFKHWLFCIAVEGRPVCARGKFVCSLNIARRSTGGWLFHTWCMFILLEDAVYDCDDDVDDDDDDDDDIHDILL